MATLNDKVAGKFEHLEKEAREALSKAGWDGHDYKNNHPSSLDYVRFRTQALNLTRVVCGENSDHYRELRRLVEDQNSAFNSYYYKDCFAVLQAAKQDFVDGLLFDVRTTIAAELLGDFIEQADGLVNGGHDAAAVSVGGAVLEDSMRRLCVAHGIAVPEKTNINWLNTELGRKGVYDNLVKKRITALAEVRNLADHGHFDKVKPEDARDLVTYVRRFCADYLSPTP